MKLQAKITRSNLLVNLIFMIVAGLSIYFIVQAAVFHELDEHLLNHKHDLVQRFENEEISLKSISRVGSIGSYEWIELKPLQRKDSPNLTDEITTVVRSRFRDEPEGRYRELKTIIPIDNQYYQLTVYEEIAGWEGIALSIIGLMLALLTLWFGIVYVGNTIIIKNSLAPFFDTVSKLRNIRSEKDFTTPFPEVDTDELDELNTTLNRMLKELADSINKQKQFIQNASHELLTPLSILQHKTEELLNQDNLDEESFLKISEIQQTIIRLRKLSNALLMISRVENKYYGTNEKIHVGETIIAVEKELMPFLLAQHIRLKVEGDATIFIRGNQELFHSLLFNVLQNAFFHSPENASIDIHLFESETHHHLSIADSGPGIKTEELESVFDRFEQSSEKKNNGNNGLGLAIVRSICNLHEWHCYFEKESEQGAVFHLEIPK